MTLPFMIGHVSAGDNVNGTTLPDGPVPTYIEFNVAFLIARCGVTNGAARRRLNGIENTVAALARRWRAPAPILPADELRMSVETCQRMIGWVTAEMQTSETLDARLAPYTSGTVCDASIPAGWIRLSLSGQAPASGRV